jgi:hypothetical protein
MSAIGTFFRHCPSCGRRFEIRLVSRNEVSGESELERAKRPFGSQQPLASPVFRSIRSIQLEAGGPATVNISTMSETKELRYAYRCGHCGHEWSEEKVTTFESRPPSDYRGD